MWPEASMVRAPAGAARDGPTASMRSRSTSTSARLRTAGRPARICPPRISSAMPASVALLLLGQQFVGVGLLERDLALQLEILRVEIARLLHAGWLELAERHLGAGDLLGIHEARADLRGADGAVGVHLGMVLDHVPHALVEMLAAECVVGALERRAQERLQAVRVLGDRVLAGTQGRGGPVEAEIAAGREGADVGVLLLGDLADARLVHHEEGHRVGGPA